MMDTMLNVEEHCQTCMLRYHCDDMTYYECLSHCFRHYKEDQGKILDNAFKQITKRNKDKEIRRKAMEGCSTCLNRTLCGNGEKEYCLQHNLEGYDEDYSVIYELEAQGTSCAGCENLGLRFPYPTMYPCNCCSRAFPKDYYRSRK